MKVGIAYDLVPLDKGDGPDDRYEEFDKPETIEAIAEVIRGEGHEVVLLGDGREFLTKVLANPPDFVFNMAEGEGSGRCREARVPAALEMLGIPYSGSDPLTLAASLDKPVAKTLVHSADHVRMPGGWSLPANTPDPEAIFRELFEGLSGMGHHEAAGETPRVILKPAFEGSSKGIRARCLATGFEEALSIYRELVQDYHQPILIEQFIDGDELTVGLAGNSSPLEGRPEILGIMKVVPRDRTRPFVYSLDVKRDWRKQVDYETPARLDAQVVTALQSSSLAVFQALGCRDFARIDFRVRHGNPYFIEANPLPGLAPGVSDLVILAEGHGIGYADLIRKIFHASLTRVGLM